MSKKRGLSGKKHPKRRLARGVVLESRRTIGFARTPVQEPGVQPVIYDLPLRHFTEWDDD